MTSLQLLWFGIICFLFSVYFFLEGFDYGIGMSLLFLAKDRKERNVLVQSFDPVWEANQVWLVIAGGAMFASFPVWYATLFSSFYLFFLLILAALIIRGMAINVRSTVKSVGAHKFWDFVFFLGSLLVPFLFGMMFISLVAGIPIDKDGNTAVTFLNYIGYLKLVGGATVTLMCLLHGLSYIQLKVGGELGERANKLSQNLYPALYVLYVAFAWLIWTDTDFFQNRTFSSIILIVILLLISVGAVKATYDRHAGKAFVLNGLSLVAVVIFLFNGLFPRVMVSSTNPKFDILIKNASSAPYTLLLMTRIACVLLPILILYQVWAYYLLNRKKVSASIHQ